MALLCGYILTCLILVCVVLAVMTLMSSSVSGKSGSVSFECGFESGAVMGGVFMIRYYMLVMVFLILDLEVGVFVLLPNSWFFISWGLMIVIFILSWLYLLGTIYEWGVGSLSWCV
nr:NADH dehydrogenase subunit 3 [Pseudoacanthocephalus sp.]